MGIQGGSQVLPKRITTSDIADGCGVSRATVSAILNGKKGVGEETRRKVLAWIREHNAEPGLLSRSMVCELSRMVAVLAADLSKPFYAELFSGMSYGKNFSRSGSFEPLRVELRGENVQLIPSICFEDTVGRLSRKFARPELQMLVNITNDGWFGTSEATLQHMANSKFRAVEVRRPSTCLMVWRWQANCQHRSSHQQRKRTTDTTRT